MPKCVRSAIGLGLFISVITLVSGGEWKFQDKAREVVVGMTAEQVTKLLGVADSEVSNVRGVPNTLGWHYRFESLAKRFDGADDINPSFAIGRFRVLLRGGVVVETAGLWPKSHRPPSGTPKGKIMLVNAASVYDRLQSTLAYNAELRRLTREKELAVEKMNSEGSALVAEYAKIQPRLKRFEGSAVEKQRLQAAAEKLLGQIEEKKQEVESFTSKGLAELRESRLRIIDLRVPLLSEAILSFSRERGYDYVFEIKTPIFGTEAKPAFLAGVDETDAIVKWIDAESGAPR